jgi:hypothetical protein
MRMLALKVFPEGRRRHHFNQVVLIVLYIERRWLTYRAEAGLLTSLILLLVTRDPVCSILVLPDNTTHSLLTLLSK